MDSFRPGSSSYCPFPNEDEIINNSDIEGGVNEPTNDDLENNNVSIVNLHNVTSDASSDNDDTDNESLGFGMWDRSGRGTAPPNR